MALLRIPLQVLRSQPNRVIWSTPPRCADDSLDVECLNLKLKFRFSEENMSRAGDLLGCYPEEERRGALLPLLDLAQRQYGWLPISAMATVAEMLKMETFEVWQVANFYSMFNLSPVGKFHLKVCSSTPCQLRGGDEILKTCEHVVGLKAGETSADMKFTLRSVCCMGACVNAPVMLVNDDIYEDLTVLDTEQILCALKEGVMLEAGPRDGRLASEPKGGATTLLIEPPPAGFGMQEIRKGSANT
ncbi:hypothetical protein KR222_007965 [Zaprionus bogoriensis]|nr:hypothetical protein KR222_007965 [Zaprionus bogoriensis]